MSDEFWHFCMSFPWRLFDLPFGSHLIPWQAISLNSDTFAEHMSLITFRKRLWRTFLDSRGFWNVRLPKDVCWKTAAQIHDACLQLWAQIACWPCEILRNGFVRDQRCTRLPSDTWPSASPRQIWPWPQCQAEHMWQGLFLPAAAVTVPVRLLSTEGQLAGDFNTFSHPESTWIQ